MERYFKFIGEYEVEGGRILLYPITSEDIEEQTEKKLNEKQLYRICIALCCIDDIREHINKAIDEAIAIALDDTEPMWKDVDEQYKDRLQNND